MTYGSSIHTARWLSQLKDQTWDLHLFPVDEWYLHRDLRDVTVHYLLKNEGTHIDSSVRQKHFPWPFKRGKERLRKVLNKLPGDRGSNAHRLAQVIRSLKPDIIHSMDIEGGALTSAARQNFAGAFPPWIHSSWGSDLFYFGRDPQHAARVRAVFESCNYLMADCQRELELAPDFGFKGEILGVFSAAGGFHIEEMRQYRSQNPPSSRHLIMLKGRQGLLGGRALYALKALQMCADDLKDYEVVIYLPQGESIASAADYISFTTGLRFRTMPEHTPHTEMLKLMGNARMAIAVGMTDGTPHAMLEAMVMGALPIQSNTADTRGWIEDGRNGLLVSPEDAESIAAAIRKAVTDDCMADEADRINERLTRERIDSKVVAPRVIEAYERIAAQSRSDKRRG